MNSSFWLELARTCGPLIIAWVSIYYTYRSTNTLRLIELRTEKKYEAAESILKIILDAGRWGYLNPEKRSQSAYHVLDDSKSFVSWYEEYCKLTIKEYLLDNDSQKNCRDIKKFAVDLFLKYPTIYSNKDVHLSVLSREQLSKESETMRVLLDNAINSLRQYLTKGIEKS